MAPRNFLFIELTNQPIVAFLSALRNIFMGRPVSTGIHVTIKGPQRSRFRTSAVRKFLEKGYPLLIEGVGIFENNDAYIVYLTVDLEELRKYQLWYKPDFPNEFNPHITLYEGTNLRVAQEIYRFLCIEELSFMTTEYTLFPYTSKQLDLFSLASICEDPKAISELEASKLVKTGILERAKLVMQICH